jgi:hypothetical protein
MLPVRGEKSGKKTVPTGGVHCQWEEERKRVPVRGGVLLGRGLILAVGWNGSRGPVSYFSLLYFFFFSVFLILSQILQKML